MCVACVIYVTRGCVCCFLRKCVCVCVCVLQLRYACMYSTASFINVCLSLSSPLITTCMHIKRCIHSLYKCAHTSCVCVYVCVCVCVSPLMTTCMHIKRCIHSLYKSAHTSCVCMCVCVRHLYNDMYVWKAVHSFSVFS